MINSVPQRQLTLSLALLMLCLSGCGGGPGRIATPSVDADDVAQSVLELYDRDSDAQLNDAELQDCPSLQNALPVYDTNGDGRLSQAELVEGIDSWAQRGIGATAVPFTVRFDGRPLAGAEVKLIPAEFLADVLLPASGVADETGSGSLKMPAENRPANVPDHLPVMQPGLYRVEITHPSREIPAKYNTATTLGLEAGIAGQNPSGVLWELNSKKN